MVDGELVEMTREELYEKVWSVPSIKLCKEFGFSDVALAKLCKKHRVPKPPLGYWAKVQNGQAVKRPPLSKIYDSRLEKVRITKSTSSLDDSDPIFGAISQAEEILKEKVIVHESLDDLHALAASTLKICRDSKADSNGLIEAGADSLDISVSPNLLERAVKLYSALLRTVEKVGGSATIKRINGKQVTSILLSGELVQIRLEEQLDSRQKELTPKQIKEREKRPWMYKDVELEYFPSGKLKFQIIEGSGLGYRTKWQDTEAAPLEKSLNAFINGILRAIQLEKAERLKKERREREWAEARKLEEDKKNRADDLKRRVYDLAEKVEEWEKSRKLTEYLEVLEHSWVEKNGPIEPQSEFAEWLVWARKYASLLDPVSSIVDSGQPYDKKRALPSEYAYLNQGESQRPKPWFPGRLWFHK